MNATNEHLTGQAINFYNHGMEQLDEHLLVGEREAKAAVLVGLVLGKNVLLSGLPGGGKSTLANNVYRLIEGVEREDVVMVPGQNDLTATQLVGGEVKQQKTTELDYLDKDSQSWTETNSHFIKGMIQPETKILRLEEPNRAPAHALQSILPVLENRRMETSAGWIELPNLLSVFATMNPTETRESTFKISNAMTSRFTVGAEMGVVHNGEDRQDMNKKVRKYNGVPENVKPIVDIPTLAELQAYVLKAAITEDIGDLIDKVTVATAEALKDNRVIETDRRLALQIIANAKALAGLRSAENVVRPIDVNDSVHLVVGARIGAQSLGATDSANNIAEHVMQPYATRRMVVNVASS